jgi:hypothetical protein
MLHSCISSVNQDTTTVARFAQEATLGWIGTGGFLASPAPPASMARPILVGLFAYIRA